MSENNFRKKLVVGILAHVDAGKTTLSEGLLYLSGRIRKMGRVDHGDTFLDTYALEKERGITIFSKQAILDLGDTRFTLLDTPGHVDFSAEMERTLQVLDAAILVISGADGVQSHTLTLWKLLERYHIPVFLFINKMDQPGTDRASLLSQVQEKLSGTCTDFTAAVWLPDEYGTIDSAGLAEAGREYGKPADGSSEGSRPDKAALEAFMESVAVCDDALLEAYLETGAISREEIAALIRERKLFPCFFGSALHMTGVREFLDGLDAFTRQEESPLEFGARVFKISRDAQGNRLTWIKVTGGRLRVKESLSGREGDEEWEEKTDQLRLYSGAKYELAESLGPGDVAAVTGLTHTRPGEGLGFEPDAPLPSLEPVLNYQLLLPADCEVHRMLRSLRELQEEDPLLHLLWDERLREIHVMLMGEVQTEILRSVIWERFHVAVEFGPGDIVYKETIAAPVIGVGHFEPLRHYAEVHLLLEPGEPGSGLVFFTALSEDVLDRNWQRLILTHLAEREHPGVLTGSVITDMQITLINGRAHIKHTEGGDFRQATYRAVRNGLKKARSVLLEPVYEFRLELPSGQLGRAMTDIQQMGGSFSSPEMDGDQAVLTGSAPVAGMRDYPRQVLSYTGGQGRLSCTLKGYEPCKNAQEVVEALGYDSERDTENPTGSVFCAHGAGFIVPWDEVESYMHLQDDWSDGKESAPGGEAHETWAPAADRQDHRPEARMGETDTDVPQVAGEARMVLSRGMSQTGSRQDRASVKSFEDDEELQAIFERTFGPVKRRAASDVIRRITADEEPVPVRYRHTPPKPQDEYLLVDGYNVIFAWQELKDLAAKDIHAAALKLMDVLSNYQGIGGMTVILVFDAYKVEGHAEETLRYHNIYVVYTKEAETADMYIEKTVHRLGRNNKVTVATSDALEQVIILGQGAHRISAKGLQEEIRQAEGRLRTGMGELGASSRNTLIDQLPEETARWLEEMRLKGTDPS